MKSLLPHHKQTAAHQMGIGVNTVSFHLKQIYEKLQVHSKTEAVAKALREKGWFSRTLPKEVATSLLLRQE